MIVIRRYLRRFRQSSTVLFVAWFLNFGLITDGAAQSQLPDLRVVDVWVTPNQDTSQKYRIWAKVDNIGGSVARNFNLMCSYPCKTDQSGMTPWHLIYGFNQIIELLPDSNTTLSTPFNYECVPVPPVPEFSCIVDQERIITEKDDNNNEFKRLLPSLP